MSKGKLGIIIALIVISISLIAVIIVFMNNRNTEAPIMSVEDLKNSLTPEEKQELKELQNETNSIFDKPFEELPPKVQNAISPPFLKEGLDNLINR